MTAAILFPRPVADVANPYVVPPDLELTWAPASIGLAVARHLGHWGVVAFLAVGLGLAMLPLFDRGAERRITRKPVVLLIGMAVVAALVWAWVAGSRIDTVAPDASAAIEAVPAAGDSGDPTRAASPGAAETGGAGSGGGR
jgi:quinol-cytochrome oxidoreductase complex cytochrome b subunit